MMVFVHFRTWGISRLKTGHDGPKMVPDSPKMAQVGATQGPQTARRREKEGEGKFAQRRGQFA